MDTGDDVIARIFSERAQLSEAETAAVATGLRHLLGEPMLFPDLRAYNPLLRSALRKIEAAIGRA